MRFFEPTSELKEMLLLKHIKEYPDTTQKEIAAAISSSVSMVNAYIDKLEEKGYMRRDYKSSKVVYYKITCEGVRRGRFLLINYIKELTELYILAKENVEKYLIGIEKRGYRKILIYGAGEVSETILDVIKIRSESALEIIAIVDDDEDIQGNAILNHIIISKEDIHKYEHDGILITSYAYEDQIKNKLNEINYPEDKIISFFN